MRLDVIVSTSGECPDCDVDIARALVKSGVVAVNGIVVSTPAWQVLPNEVVSVDGRSLQRAEHKLIFHNKIAGTLSQNSHPSKPTYRGVNVYEGLPPALQYDGLGLFGRLDRDTTGLILFGTDGGMNALFQHPRTKLPKIYVATLRAGMGRLKGSQLPTAESDTYDYDGAVRKFAEGLLLKDGQLCAPAELVWLSTDPAKPVVQITIHEGKYHQVKKMVASIGSYVVALHRVSVGGFLLDELNLAPGEYREATAQEMRKACAPFPLTAEIRDLSDAEAKETMRTKEAIAAVAATDKGECLATRTDLLGTELGLLTADVQAASARLRRVVLRALALEGVFRRALTNNSSDFTTLVRR